MKGSWRGHPTGIPEENKRVWVMMLRGGDWGRRISQVERDSRIRTGKAKRELVRVG